VKLVPLTKGNILKAARLSRKYPVMDANEMRSGYYYWMTNTGEVIEINFGDHDWYAEMLFLRMGRKGLGEKELFDRGWLRIGIYKWRIDTYGEPPKKRLRAQQRAIAEWVSAEPGRTDRLTLPNTSLSPMEER
jgi:hypothetical protein